MSSALQKVSGYFFLALLGVYALDRVFLFLSWENSITLFLGNVLLLPLGVITLIYIFMSAKVELEEKNMATPLLHLALLLLFLAVTGLLLFYSLFA